MIRVLIWLIDRGIFGRSARQHLATGENLYVVSLARSGRIIEAVRVRADDEEEAILKAKLYLRANIYAHKVVKQEEADAVK